MRILLSALLALPLWAVTSATVTLSGVNPVNGDWSARAGVSNQLNVAATCPDGGGCASYLWEQIEGPENAAPLVWNSKTITSPTVKGAVFGQYIVKATVTPVTGSAVTVTFTFGAVAEDHQGITIPSPNPLHEQLLGSTVRMGRGAWPTLDQRQQYISNFFGSKYGTPPYAAYWETDTPGPGTITVTGATTATGSAETDFPSYFNCDGNQDATPMDYHHVILRTPNPIDGSTKYFDAFIKSCTAHTLEFNFSETRPVGGPYTYTRSRLGNCPGAGREDCSDQLMWTRTATYINYYGSDIGHFATYQRTGLKKYRQYAHWLASKELTNPFDVLGEGESMDQSPRNANLQGLMLYAEAGHMDKWPYLNHKLDYWRAQSIRTDDTPQRDAREGGAMLAEIALAGKYHPDITPMTGRRALYADATKKSLDDRWAPSRQTGSVWHNYYTDSVIGPVSVTNGNTAVTSSGKFLPAHCDGANSSLVMIWFTTLGNPTLLEDLTGDPDAYRCIYVDANTITLVSPYRGTTSSSKYFQANKFIMIGTGYQPYMQGFAGQGLHHAYLTTCLTTCDSRVPGWISQMSQTLQTEAIKPSNRGYYYGCRFPGCVYNPLIIGTGQDYEAMAPDTGRWMCDNFTDGDSGRRAYRIETAFTLMLARKYDPANTPQSAIDEIIGVNMGEGGGPHTENGWTNIDTAPATIDAYHKAKDFGFWWGRAYLGPVLASHVGTLAAESLRTVSVNLTMPANATSSILTVTDPSGHTRSVTCSSFPCIVQVDDRQGGEGQLTIQHKNGSTVIANALVGLIQ